MCVSKEFKGLFKFLHDNSNSGVSSEMIKCFYKAHGLFQYDLRLEKFENELYSNIKKNT